MKPSILIGALVLLSACYHGPSLRHFEPAHSPEGIAADLRLKHRQVRGELIEVQDSALVVLTDSQAVALVPLRSIRLGDFSRLGSLIEGSRADRQTLERLRLLSRFPAGLTPALRSQLLSAYGQTELVVIQ